MKLNLFENAKVYYHKKYGILDTILPELIAVKFGLKKAVTLKIATKKFSASIQSIIKKNLWYSKLYVDYYPSVAEGNEVIIMLISRKKLSIERIAIVKNENFENRFTYPACCISSFLEDHSEKRYTPYYGENKTRDLFIKNRQSVFDFKTNPFLRDTPFHLYIHLPCSLGCLNTLEYTNKLLNLIKIKNKKLYCDTIYFNRAPVFYTDICSRGVLFNGTVINRKIIYKNFYYSFSPNKHQIEMMSHNLPGDRLLYIKLLKKISRGDQLELCGSKLVIKKNGKVVANVNKPDHLHWKVMNFK